MEIVPLGPGFAAELRGVTLAEIAADTAAYKETRAAFEQHSVIVFRGQDVTDEAQLAFSRRFGPLEVTKVGSLGAGTNLVILSTIDESGKVVPADHRLALRNKANQLWHTDSTFKRVPALASVLSARVIPALGGETEYVSTRLAWERLDPALRKRLESSFAWHDYAHSRGKIASDLASPEERAALPPQCWRMVWKNPANGRNALYLASHAYAIEGMEQAAAQRLLAELMDAATAPGSAMCTPGVRVTSSCGTTARPCIVVDHGQPTRRGSWCARRSPRLRRTGLRPSAHHHGRPRNKHSSRSDENDQRGSLTSRAADQIVPHKWFGIDARPRRPL